MTDKPVRERMDADLTLAPCTIKAAQRWVAEKHRHLPKIQGGLFAVAVAKNGSVCGVGIAANPPRVWQGTGRFVIARLATDGTYNACSMLYGALCRAGKALGYVEAWTYTLPHEPGTSLLASGFEFMGETRAEDWNRPSRPRATVEPTTKKRWRRRL